MGKLRLEPKEKTMSHEHYEKLKDILKKAIKASEQDNVYWDPDEGEDALNVAKEFRFVAEKERMPVMVRRLRNSTSLQFVVGKGSITSRPRMSAIDYKERVIKILGEAGRPLKKSEIVKRGHLNPSTWNIRIQELLKSGEVKRRGSRREATYMLPDPA